MEIYSIFFPLDNNKLGLLIADVSGKSISACLYMVVTRSLFRAFSKKSLSSSEIIKTLNECLCTDNTSSMFVTTFYAILDVETGRLNYCNAGHNIPYLISEGKIQKLPSHSALPLGVAVDHNDKIPEYKEVSMQLKKNDRLFFYTDGVTEAMNSANDQFSESRLESLLSETSSNSAKEVINKLTVELKKFTGNAPQSDDITMMYVLY